VGWVFHVVAVHLSLCRAGDTDVDLFVTSLSSQPNRLFVNNGTGFFSEQGAARGVAVNINTTATVRSPAVGDFDNDGTAGLELAILTHVVPHSTP
jgi:hypothetical protein